MTEKLVSDSTEFHIPVSKNGLLNCKNKAKTFHDYLVLLLYFCGRKIFHLNALIL